jgi:hypothetical protein
MQQKNDRQHDERLDRPECFVLNVTVGSRISTEKRAWSRASSRHATDPGIVAPCRLPVTNLVTAGPEHVRINDFVTSRRSMAYRSRLQC